MSQMTWNQFKKHVDTVLKKKGISGDEEIFYIDSHMPDCKDIGVEQDGAFELQVTCDEDGISIYS